MGKQKAAQTDGRSAEALVKQGAKAEKRMLRRERKAERTLTEARARLRKAQERLERRLSAVSDAEALLRTRQAARAAGPVWSNGASNELLSPSIAGATEVIVQASAPEEPVEAAASLILPPAKKPPARRRTSRSAAPKEHAS
jgi:hypothetical protein